MCAPLPRVFSSPPLTGGARLTGPCPYCSLSRGWERVGVRLGNGFQVPSRLSPHPWPPRSQRNPTAKLYTRTVLYHQGTKDSTKDTKGSGHFEPQTWRFCSSSCPWCPLW